MPTQGWRPSDRSLRDTRALSPSGGAPNPFLPQGASACLGGGVQYDRARAEAAVTRCGRGTARNVRHCHRDAVRGCATVSTQPAFTFGNPAVLTRPFQDSSIDTVRTFDVALDGRVLGIIDAGQTEPGASVPTNRGRATLARRAEGARAGEMSGAGRDAGEKMCGRRKRFTAPPEEHVWTRVISTLVLTSDQASRCALRKE